QEAVDQHGVVRRDFRGVGNVAGKVGFVVDDFHAATAQDIGRTDKHGITDLVSDLLGILKGNGRAVLRGGQACLVQDAGEGATVLCEVNCLRRGAQDRHAGVGKLLCELQGCL